MAQLDFSVVIPTFNRTAELRRCLAALARLEYPRDLFEIVIVDDGGDIPAADVVAGFAGEVKTQTLRQSRGGPASARNAGVHVCRGKYLAFTDDDCIPTPGWLSALRNSLKSSGTSLVGGRALNVLTGNPYSTASQIIVDFAHEHYRSDQGGPRFFASNNMAVNTSMFRDLGGFTVEFRTSEDRDFCDRWITSGHRLLYAPDAVVHHAHRLEFSSFWDQHMKYGRGAWKFYRAFGKRHKGKSSIEPGFYGKILGQLPRMIMRHGRKRAFLFFLMGVWQTANLAGFLAEAASSAKSRKTKEAGIA